MLGAMGSEPPTVIDIVHTTRVFTWLNEFGRSVFSNASEQTIDLSDSFEKSVSPTNRDNELTLVTTFSLNLHRKPLHSIYGSHF